MVFVSLTDPKEFFPENGGVDGDGKKIVGDLGDFIDESDDLDVSDEDDEDEEVRFFGIKNKSERICQESNCFGNLMPS